MEHERFLECAMDDGIKEKDKIKKNIGNQIYTFI